ncbi:hypothetical protein VTN02DRAFT_3787 [Thermoascus thermophilus]
MLASTAAIFFVFAGLFLAGFRFLVNRYRHSRQAKAWSCRPAHRFPSGFFGIRTFVEFNKAQQEKSFVKHIRELHRKYGNTIELEVLGNPMVFTIEPENIKAILATQFTDFGLGIRNKSFRPLLGDGIFTLDGPGWWHSRALLRPQFTREQVSDFDHLDVHVQRLIDVFPKDGSAFDIQELFFRLTLDSSTEFLFGESVDSLLSAKKKGISETEKQNFADAWNYGMHVLARRVRARSFYWLLNPKKFRDGNKVIHRFVDYYVDKALRYTDNSNSDVKSPPKEQGRYIFLQALASQTRDRKVLRDQLLNILLAGRDTTSSLLSSVFYFLSHHPAIWDTLRKEILDTFGAGGEKEEINFRSLKDLPYLRYVLNETLRLLPPVPSNVRFAVKDTTLPVGGGPDGRSPVYIRKGQSVGYTVWSLHRRQDIWGADADEFRPERWREFTPKGWEYIPFNGGPRICLGQQYALTEASYVIVKLLQRFDTLENADPGPYPGSQPVLDHSLTMTHWNGVHVRLYSRGQ